MKRIPWSPFGMASLECYSALRPWNAMGIPSSASIWRARILSRRLQPKRRPRRLRASLVAT